MRYILIYISILWLVSSCKPTKPTSESSGLSSFELKSYYIAPYQVHCEGEGIQQCFLVKRKINDQWQNFYSTIEGFDFEPGYSYIIKVKLTAIANPPADGSSMCFELHEIIQKQKITQAITSLYDIWGVLRLNNSNLKRLGVAQMFEINTTKKQILGQGACNSFSANLAIKEGSNKFSLSNFSSTEKYCDKSKLEEEYFNTLQNVDAFYRYNNRLLIISGNKVVIEAIKMD